jgi:hypothetical protein
MQVEYVGKGIGNFPSLSEAWRYVEVFVASEQIVEYQVTDAFGLRVESDTRIEVARAALDDHDQSIRVGARRT